MSCVIMHGPHLLNKLVTLVICDYRKRCFRAFSLGLSGQNIHGLKCFEHSFPSGLRIFAHAWQPAGFDASLVPEKGQGSETCAEESLNVHQCVSSSCPSDR